jgi:acetyl esterase
MITSGFGLAARIGEAHNLPVFDCLTERLDPSAAIAIELLSEGSPMSEGRLAEARQRFRRSRAPLLAQKDPVASLVEVQPTAGGTPGLIILRPVGSSLSERLPALVYLHGGGWTVGDFATYEPFCRQLANALGRVVVWVDYRLAPEHPFPAALEDTWNAVEWLVTNAERLGIDRERIAIGGDSAGGNLAAVTAIAARDGVVAFTPQFQLLIYPCLDMMASLPSHEELAKGYLLTGELYAWYRRNYAGASRDLRDWRLSPLFAEDLADVAPAVVLYAGFDPLRDEAILFSARLLDAGVPVEAIFFPGQIHGFILLGGMMIAASSAISRIAGACSKFGTPGSADFPAPARPDVVQDNVR